MCVLYCFFFFKQKTAYELRISDWSSDVCSSDLLFETTWTSLGLVTMLYLVIGLGYARKPGAPSAVGHSKRIGRPLADHAVGRPARQGHAIPVKDVSPGDRKSVV